MEKQLQPKQTKIGTAADPPLNTTQAAKYLRISTSTLYKRIGDVPHRKQFGKLYFFRSELERYLRNSPLIGTCA